MTEARLRALLDKAHPEKKSRILNVRLTPTEFDELEAHARKEKVGTATLGRLLILVGLDLNLPRPKGKAK